MKPRPIFREETTLGEDFRLLLILLAFILILHLAPKRTKTGFVIVTGIREVMKVILP